MNWRQQYNNSTINKKESIYYGRCINLSYGLILGLLIDKALLYMTKGLSVFIPPFAVLLISKGKVIKQIRFEKNFGRMEFLVKHFVK